jgi:hypothetical protein
MARCGFPHGSPSSRPIIRSIRLSQPTRLQRFFEQTQSVGCLLMRWRGSCRMSDRSVGRNKENVRGGMNGIPTTNLLRPGEPSRIPNLSGGRRRPSSSPSGHARRIAVRYSRSGDHAIPDTLRYRRPLTHFAPSAVARESFARLSGRRPGSARWLSGISGTRRARGSACGAASNAAANSSLSLAAPPRTPCENNKARQHQSGSRHVQPLKLGRRRPRLNPLTSSSLRRLLQVRIGEHHD